MTKAERQRVHEKYNGHCAYCGKVIEYKNMQIDHIIPKRNMDDKRKGTNDFENLNPACRRCNHYKRASTIEGFRYLMLTLHERIRQQYISKVAEDYGIITVVPWDGRFYFEKYLEEDRK